MRRSSDSNWGADEFNAKPFDIDELEARLQAVQRRSKVTPSSEPPPQPTNRLLHVGNLVVDRRRRLALIGNEPLSLTPTEYRLVSTLAERVDEVVRRKDLALKVWGYEDASSGRRIDVHIRRLRAKLSATRTPAPFIVVVRGLGYQLTSDPSANLVAKL